MPKQSMLDHWVDDDWWQSETTTGTDNWQLKWFQSDIKSTTRKVIWNSWQGPWLWIHFELVNDDLFCPYILCLIFQIFGKSLYICECNDPSSEQYEIFYIQIYLKHMKLQGLDMNIKAQEKTGNKRSIWYKIYN